MTKECIKCGETFSLSEYYKHSGMKDRHLSKCKECCKKDVQENYRKNIEHYKRYDRSRVDDENRREKRKEYSRRLRANNPEKVYEYARKWQSKNRHKRKASQKINDLIHRGKIEKQPCVECDDVNSQGHHEDYNKPLDVIWLCQKHHMMRHRKPF